MRFMKSAVKDLVSFLAKQKVCTFEQLLFVLIYATNDVLFVGKLSEEFKQAFADVDLRRIANMKNFKEINIGALEFGSPVNNVTWTTIESNWDSIYENALELFKVSEEGDFEDEVLQDNLGVIVNTLKAMAHILNDLKNNRVTLHGDPEVLKLQIFVVTSTFTMTLEFASFYYRSTDLLRLFEIDQMRYEVRKIYEKIVEFDQEDVTVGSLYKRYLGDGEKPQGMILTEEEQEVANQLGSKWVRLWNPEKKSKAAIHLKKFENSFWAMIFVLYEKNWRRLLGSIDDEDTKSTGSQPISDLANSLEGLRVAT